VRVAVAAAAVFCVSRATEAMTMTTTTTTSVDPSTSVLVSSSLQALMPYVGNGFLATHPIPGSDGGVRGAYSGNTVRVKLTASAAPLRCTHCVHSFTLLCMLITTIVTIALAGNTVRVKLTASAAPLRCTHRVHALRAFVSCHAFHCLHCSVAC
jgi:hypothetical protein